MVVSGQHLKIKEVNNIDLHFTTNRYGVIKSWYIWSDNAYICDKNINLPFYQKKSDSLWTLWNKTKNSDMNVSGRKLKDFESSITKASSEYFEQNCDPCLTIGQNKQAHAYCEDCQELLCNNCFSYHLRTKALKNHKLIAKSSTESIQVIHTAKKTEIFTEECLLHKHEKIKFFCPGHESLGCHDCIALKHRTCSIEYIPDTCAAIGDSDEYKDVIRKLDQKLREVGEVTERAKSIEKEIDVSHTSLLDEIAKFRMEINDHLDQLQKEIQSDADAIKLKDKKVVERVLETCTSVSSDIDKFQTSLQDHKACLREGQLYITMKRAQSKLKSDEIKSADEMLRQTRVRFFFDRSDDFENLLTRHFKFGKVSFATVAETQNKDASIGKLSFKEDINVKTESDKNECRITGCVVLPSNKLVLADDWNNKLKLVDTRNKAVIEEQTLDSAPFDITALPPDLIAVSLPEKKQVLVMTTSQASNFWQYLRMSSDRNMSLVRRISVKGLCRGMTYHHDQLYVLCKNPSSVFLLDLKGTVKNVILLNSDICPQPHCIRLAEDSKHMFISDSSVYNIGSVTFEGEMSVVFTHNELKGPQGMLMLEDGSLLVCCWSNGNLLHISGDLKRGHIVLDCLKSPQSICYDKYQQEVYIGCWDDQLKVFSLKK